MFTHYSLCRYHFNNVKWYFEVKKNFFCFFFSPSGPRAQQLDGEECPLHVQHPPTGEEFALGCGVCRNAHTF